MLTKDAFAAEPMESFLVKGKANPTESYHFQYLEEKVLPQFEKYSALAKKFGFEGVAINVNTDFLWATFQQTTEYLKSASRQQAGNEDPVKEGFILG